MGSSSNSNESNSNNSNRGRGSSSDGNGLQLIRSYGGVSGPVQAWASMLKSVPPAYLVTWEGG